MLKKKYRNCIGMITVVRFTCDKPNPFNVTFTFCEITSLSCCCLFCFCFFDWFLLFGGGGLVFWLKRISSYSFIIVKKIFVWFPDHFTYKKTVNF